MANEVTYRHNVLTINSVDTFFHIRGVFRGGVRDVYFIRALGEERDMARFVTKIDDEMSLSAAGNKDLLYRRITAFPHGISGEDTTFYLQSFEKWKRTKTADLRNAAPDRNKFSLFLDNAIRQVLKEYRLVKGQYSDTAEKNFIIKLLFWLDQLFGEEIRQWSEKKTIKIAADNITKDQEYLFLYMLTYLGFDVLIYNSRGDTVTQTLKPLSKELTLGGFGKTVLPPYVPKKPEPPKPPVQPKPAQPPVPQRPTQPMQPQRPNQPAQNQWQNQPAQNQWQNQPAQNQWQNQPQQNQWPNQPPQNQWQNQPQQNQWQNQPQQNQWQNQPQQNQWQNQPQQNQWQNQPQQNQWPNQPPQNQWQNQPPQNQWQSQPAQPPRRQEKSFEELAQMASSVVMIIMFDRTGKPVGTGSGVVIGSEGYILTNNHVVSAGKIFAVMIENDKEIYKTTEIIKHHQKLDLAIIRIHKRIKALPVYAGPKELVRGQKVVAIGSPRGMFNSVSDGIISGFRKIDTVDMIQFTAPTSHGSSGGALLNMYGEVIGISTAGMDQAQNINLAVEYKQIRDFAGAYLDK